MSRKKTAGERPFPPSPLDLPEATEGRFSLTHRYGDEFDVVSMRESILTGRRALRVKFTDGPLRIHELRENGRVWMTDLPSELRQMGEALAELRPSGRVLIGGLGLGLIARMAAAVPEVTHVDVVEIAPEVAKLSMPEPVAKVNVIVSDLRAYLEQLPAWNYDCAFFDTWAGTGATTWWDDVFPVRRLIANRFGRVRLECWAEDMMRSQVVSSLTTAPRPFWHYRLEDMPLSPEDALKFVYTVGMPAWEKRWGSAYPEGYPLREEGAA